MTFDLSPQRHRDWCCPPLHPWTDHPPRCNSNCMLLHVTWSKQFFWAQGPQPMPPPVTPTPTPILAPALTLTPSARLSLPLTVILLLTLGLTSSCGSNGRPWWGATYTVAAINQGPCVLEHNYHHHWNHGRPRVGFWGIFGVASIEPPRGPGRRALSPPPPRNENPASPLASAAMASSPLLL